MTTVLVIAKQKGGCKPTLFGLQLGRGALKAVTLQRNQMTIVP